MKEHRMTIEVEDVGIIRLLSDTTEYTYWLSLTDLGYWKFGEVEVSESVNDLTLTLAQAFDYELEE